MDHPAHEELVLLHSGELDPDRTPDVQAHLAACPSCDAAYQRLDHIYRMVADSTPKRRRSGRGLAAKGVAVALSGLVAVYLLTSGTASARADELLSKASTEEMKTIRRQIVRIESGGLKCHLVSDQPSRECDAISSAIRESGWRANELLSPQKFQQWRRGVSRKQDSVEKSEGEIRLTTRTAESSLQVASMRIRTSDYRALSARYEFAAGDERPRVVEVAEVDHLPAAPLVTETSEEKPAPAPRAADAAVQRFDPADLQEAKARWILHEAGLDGNVLLTVDRAGAPLRVWGVTPDDRTKDTLSKQLEPLGVAVALSSEREQQEHERPTPWNPEHGDAPPLAQKHIDRMFPNQPEARQQYLNNLDRLARELAGAARDREAVRALLPRVARSPEASRLSTVAAELDRRILDGAVSLRRQLERLLPDPAPETDATLSAADGLELYNLVQRIAILSVQRDPLTLDAASNRLAVLSRRR